jgi:lipopolysaccharide export system protein LptC
MTNTGNLHSRIVGWAKILLPLFALALLSTLFLFARTPRQPTDIDLEEVTRIAREQRVSAPEFSGVTDDGAVVVISAKTARPDSTEPDAVSVDEIFLRMDNTDGSFVQVTAPLGEIAGRKRSAQFLGLARLETSTGYRMETNGLIADLNTGVIESLGLLEIRAPFGELTAGNVTFSVASDELGQQMLFTNGVRLLYNPQTP